MLRFGLMRVYWNAISLLCDRLWIDRCTDISFLLIPIKILSKTLLNFSDYIDFENRQSKLVTFPSFYSSSCSRINIQWACVVQFANQLYDDNGRCPCDKSDTRIWTYFSPQTKIFSHVIRFCGIIKVPIFF